MSLRFGVAAQLVEHRALRVQDAPVGIFGRVRAAEDVERLVVIAGLGQRTAVGAEQRHIVRIADRGLLQHRNGLGALIGRAQGAGISDSGIGVVVIVAIAGTQDVDRAPPVGVAARRIGCTEPSR